MRMKITYVLWNLDCTGGVRVLFNVVNGLIDRGHDVTLVTYGSRANWFPLKAKIQKKKTKLPQLLSENRLAHAVYGISHLTREIPDSDITVATFYPTAYSVFLSSKSILFYHIQHYEAIGYIMCEHALDPLFRCFAGMTYRLPLNWIVNSTWVRNILKKKFHKDGFVINPGIDLDVFYPREVEKERNVKRVLCLGKSAPVKGLRDLFEGMTIVCKERSDVKLVLYGSEPYLESLAPTPCEYVYRPSDEKLARLYSIADAVVVPSWYESFPLPPLEAMACGSPVITTRFGTEDYAINKVNSIVLSPKDPKALASAILRILSDEDLSERLKKAGLQTAKKYTWDRAINKVEEVFRKAI